MTVQEASAIRFAVIFGGFYRSGENLQGGTRLREAFQEGMLLPHPSCHIIGEKDALKKVRSPSCQLTIVSQRERAGMFSWTLMTQLAALVEYFL